MKPIETVVIRHPKERLSKCSLTPLHGREEIQFYVAKKKFQLDATGYTLLAVDAPPLTPADGERPLLVLDATWKLLPAVERAVSGAPVRRSIPRDVLTAYPRVGKTFPDPLGGLASVEALFIARAMLGDPDETLLDGYHWKDKFLAQLPPQYRQC